MTPEQIVEAGVQQGASDIIVSPGSPPAVRVSGILHPINSRPVTAMEVEYILRTLLDEKQQGDFARKRDLDFAVSFSGQRFRGSAYWRDGLPALALRLIPARIPTPDQLGLPTILLDLVDQPQGLIIFSGASGQGKSTSQASLVDYLNHKRAIHVITIEDPVEFLVPSQKSIIDQREVGRDTLSFAEGARHAMRHSPDVLLVGEMRDRETMGTVLNLAETGHLILTTSHANDACQALDRLLAMFPENVQEQLRNQLSMVLLAVVNQRLVRDKYDRYVLACEVLLNGPAIAKLIREGKTAQLYNAMELDRRAGVQTMNQALQSLVSRGIVLPVEAERYMVRRESRGL